MTMDNLIKLPIFRVLGFVGIALFLSVASLRRPFILTSVGSFVLMAVVVVLIAGSFIYINRLREQLSEVFGSYNLLGMIVVLVIVIGFSRSTMANVIAIMSDYVLENQSRAEGQLLGLYRSPKKSNCMIRGVLVSELFRQQSICLDLINADNLTTGPVYLDVRKSELLIIIDKVENK